MDETVQNLGKLIDLIKHYDNLYCNALMQAEDRANSREYIVRMCCCYFSLLNRKN